MTRIAITIGVIVACTILSDTCAKGQVEFGVGPIAGVNVGTVSISPAEQYPSGLTQLGRTGTVVGLQGELGLSKKFYIVLEPTYVQNGYRVTGEGAYLNVSIDELEFPLLFKAKFLDEVIRPYAFAGANISFVLSATAIYNYPGLPPHPDQILQTFPLDFAVEFGGGAEFNVTPVVGITVDARYSFGLVNILNWSANNTLSTLAAKTTKASGVQMLVGAMVHVM